MVAGEAALVRVLRSVLTAVTADHVVVATAPALAAGVAEQLAAAGLGTAVASASMSASASASRRAVIRAGLDHLGIEPLTPGGVLVCDHRYPLSPGDVADRVLATLAEGYDAVVPTVPVTDTVKTVDQLGSVLTTVDRATLQTVQYPRAFTTSALWQLVEVSPALTPPNTADADELDGALRAGLDVGRVAGDASAFQVELPRDTQLLEALIDCRRG
jgi:2-C-methyl-D-erythritol 4-phosphate cytidylyltransferase